MSQSVVKIDPEIMSEAPCFAGTRVPIQNLIDYLEGGDSIDEFLEDFPNRFSPAGDFVSERSERKRSGARCVSCGTDDVVGRKLGFTF